MQTGLRSRIENAGSNEERLMWDAQLASVECVLKDMVEDAPGYMALILAGGHVKLRRQLDRFPQ